MGVGGSILYPGSERPELTPSWVPTLADGVNVLDYDQPPEQVASFVRSLPGGNPEIALVGPDQVLDRELVDRYSRTAP
jgi:hypothetical protein